MAKKKKRPSIFSATKAVKANARERLGTPRPAEVIPDRRSKAARGPVKHRRSMEELISTAKRGEEI